MELGGDGVRKTRLERPDGGVVFIPVTAICLAWSALVSGLIQLRSLRANFAAYELQARRCMVKGRDPRQYRLDEVHGLIGGVGGEYVREAIRELEAVHLLGFEPERLTFAKSSDDLEVEIPGFSEMLSKVQNAARLVPVPRRILRYIAGPVSKSELGTVLAHLVRCAYWTRGKGFAGDGRCKARWVAETFGISERQVKAARSKLVSSGWLIPVVSPQWATNRYGGLFRVSLTWKRPRAEVATTELKPERESVIAISRSRDIESHGRDDMAQARSEFVPLTAESHAIRKVVQTEFSTERLSVGEGGGSQVAPRPVFSTGQTAPPESDKELSFGEFKNQKPAAAGRSGVSPKRASNGRPVLRDVTRQDLESTARLLELFEQARCNGWVNGSSASRLDFVAAAEHASTYGRKNPCGFFVHLLRSKKWDFTQDDEEAARTRLRRFDDENRAVVAGLVRDLLPSTRTSEERGAEAAANERRELLRRQAAMLLSRSA